MKEYSSATAVESTVRAIFWLSKSIKLPYDIPSFDDRTRDSAKNTTMPLSSTAPWVARTEDLSCRANLFRAFTSMVGDDAFDNIWRICSNTEIVSYPATNLSVPESFCTSCALQGYNGDFLSYFFLQESPSNSSMAICWLTSMYDPDWEPFIQRILCPVNVTSFQSSEQTWKSFFFESGQDTSFHFSSTCSKEIINKKINNSCHGFSVAGVSAMGSSILSYASSASIRSHGSIEMLFLFSHCEESPWFQVRGREFIVYYT